MFGLIFKDKFSEKDYQIFINYVSDTYGKNYWKQFKKEITIPYEKIAKIRLAIEF